MSLPVYQSSAHSADTNFDLNLESPWLRIWVDIGSFLLWIPRLELAELVCYCPSPYREIPDGFGVYLGRHPDVPCRLQELRRPNDGSIFPGRWGSSCCARLQLDH